MKSVFQKPRRGRVRLRTLMAAVSVLFLFGLGVAVDSALYYNKVHAGVRVLGHSLGGLTRDEATAALTRLVDQSKKSPIILASGNRTWAIKPEDMGTEMDAAGAVAGAMDVSRESNLFVDLGRRFKLYFSGRDVPLEGKLDRRLMDEFVAGIAEEVDVAPVNPGLTTDGSTIKAVEGQKGRVVDQNALREQVSALLLSLHATMLTVPTIMKDPAIRAEDTQKAVDQAETMMASPVVVKNGDETWQLTPEQIAAYVDFVSEDRAGVSTLVPYLSAEKMDAFFDEIADSMLKKPVNATFKGDGERAWVVPGTLGQALDSVKTAAAITQAALRTTGRIAEVAVKLTEPDRTTEEAEAMGIRDKLGSFTTKWEGTADRQTNVRVATKYANNVILAPGDVYNFDKQIGPRNAKHGYRLAPDIVGPGKLDDVLGGGICKSPPPSSMPCSSPGWRWWNARITQSTSTTIPKAGTRRLPPTGRICASEMILSTTSLCGALPTGSTPRSSSMGRTKAARSATPPATSTMWSPGPT